MKELLLFASAFGVVFALGFQSLNVNTGHYRLAFVTSIFIGVFNLFLYKLVPDVNSALEVICFVGGGPLGLITSMWAHARLKKWLTRNDPVMPVATASVWADPFRDAPMWGGLNGGNVRGPR